MPDWIQVIEVTAHSLQSLSLTKHISVSSQQASGWTSKHVNLEGNQVANKCHPAYNLPLKEITASEKSKHHYWKILFKLKN